MWKKMRVIQRHRKENKTSLDGEKQNCGCLCRGYWLERNVKISSRVKEIFSVYRSVFTKNSQDSTTKLYALYAH